MATGLEPESRLRWERGSSTICFDPRSKLKKGSKSTSVSEGFVESMREGAVVTRNECEMS